MTHHVNHSGGFFNLHSLVEFLLFLPFLLAMGIYITAVVVLARRKKGIWPIYRSILWVVGVSSALSAVSGPIASKAHIHFTFHMLGHLLLGMLAPLLMVLAAPMSLIMRTLHVAQARRLSYILRSRIVCLVSNPIMAALLHVGGLWILYSSNLYLVMQKEVLLHLVVHIHIFLAGYLFTTSIIYVDPTPHRKGFLFRAIVLVCALAGHGILSKYIYAHPPIGVPSPQAETAGMLMYYGGDVIDLVLIIVFCFQWYRSSRPFRSFNQSM